MTISDHHCLGGARGYLFTAYPREVFSMLCQQLGEVSLSLKPLLIIVDVPVHETIGQSGVSMDVYVEI